MKKENKLNYKDKKIRSSTTRASINYVVPNILFQNKNLKVFYTDIHSNHFSLNY